MGNNLSHFLDWSFLCDSLTSSFSSASTLLLSSMANGKSSKSKGKRRASRTPSADLLSGSSDEAVMEVPATQNSRSRKKPRLQSSPERSSDEATMEVPATQPSGSRLRKMPRRQSSSERVMGSVLSKATKRPKKGTGLAALVALVATRGREGSTAAKEETNKGLKNAAKRPKAKNRTRSAVIVCYHNPFLYFYLTILLHQDDGIRVGKIAFLREGIKIVSRFFPVFFLKVNICSRLMKAMRMTLKVVTTYGHSTLPSQRSQLTPTT